MSRPRAPGATPEAAGRAGAAAAGAEASARRWAWSLAAVAGLAVVLRLPALRGITLWHDEAVEALMSQDVLRGRFPLFFYGQPVHGAADRYLAALVQWALGPTPLALKLGVLPLSLVFLLSVAATTRRRFGAGAATVAALYLAVPPYYLYGWNFDSRGHYPLMLVLGTWALFLGWRILGEGVARSPKRRFAGLGLLLGTAWWINYLSVTFLVPLAVALGVQALRTRPAWRAWAPRVAVAAATFLVGVTPLLAYYLGRGLVPLPPGSLTHERGFRRYSEDLVRAALPQILGVHPDVWGAAYPAVLALAAGSTLGAVLYVTGRSVAARRAPDVAGGASTSCWGSRWQPWRWRFSRSMAGSSATPAISCPCTWRCPSSSVWPPETCPAAPRRSRPWQWPGCWPCTSLAASG